MSRIYSTDLCGRTLSVEIGKVAGLANGAALVSYGETVVLSVAVAADKPRPGIDFFPLSVDYEEKLYAVGKIPGGFIKREGRPSENSILTSRVIDRPIRPLFPKDYRNDCSVTNTVMCVDQENQPELVAMLGSSIALSISDIPFQGPTSATIVGLIDGEYVFNPTMQQREQSTMYLNVTSTMDKIVMIEAEGKEIPEAVMIEAIFQGHELNKQVITFINSIVEKEGKAKQAYEEVGIPNEMYTSMKELIGDTRMEVAVFTDVKAERHERIAAIKDELTAAWADNDEWLALLDEAVYNYEKKTVRRMILKEHKRPDGRALDEVRKLTSEIDILPRTHGSALFSRGETQVLTITTLGALGEQQRIDGLDELEKNKRYMHHYNFPSYSVGESRPNRGPGRREIGHGALAEKALLPVLPSEEEFPYAIRTVSEILSSNGSTSQGSICASSLSLMAAGVPIKKPVAGITCGLVTGDTDDDFVLLTDIQGLEDFFGDMDFKVAGTKDGITAIQLDMKLQGITHEVVEKAIYNTQKSRMYILDEVMNMCISEPRAELSKYAPKIIQMQIDPEKIGEVVGPRGKTINKIIDETGVKIDIEDDGRVFVCGEDPVKVERALNIIKVIANGVKVGDVFEGKVVRLMKFGVFVEIVPGKDGMVHISKLAKERVARVEDVVNVNDMIKVIVEEIDDQGRVNLSRKALLENE